MKFDYEAAKKSGYDDEEILGFLSKDHPKFDTQAALKSGYTPNEVIEFLSNAKKENSTADEVARKILIPAKGVADAALGKFGDFANFLKNSTEEEKLEAEDYFKDHPNIKALRDFIRTPIEKTLEFGSKLPTTEQLRKSGEITPQSETEQVLQSAGEGIGSVLGLPGAGSAANLLGAAGAGAGSKIAELNQAGTGGQLTAAVVGDILSRKIGKGALSLGAKLGIPAAQKQITSSNFDKLNKAFGSTEDGKKALEFAKSKNLTAEETTLLLQSRGKQDRLSFLTSGNKKTEEIAKGLKSKLGDEYNEIIRKGRDQPLGYRNTIKLDDKLSGILEDLEATGARSEETNSAIKKIREAKNHIETKIPNIEELINTKHNLNEVSWKNVHKGKALRAKANQAINETIADTYPEAAQQLKFLDANYGKLQSIMPKLENKGFVNYKGFKVPNAFQIPLILGAGYVSPLIAKGILGKAVVNHISRNLLTNPNYQGIAKQMIFAAEKGSISAMKTSWNKLLDTAKKHDPDFYEEIKDVSIE